jgi:hypothetical protein
MPVLHDVLPDLHCFPTRQMDSESYHSLTSNCERNGRTLKKEPQYQPTDLRPNYSHAHKMAFFSLASRGFFSLLPPPFSRPKLLSRLINTPYATELNFRKIRIRLHILRGCSQEKLSIAGRAVDPAPSHLEGQSSCTEWPCLLSSHLELHSALPRS